MAKAVMLLLPFLVFSCGDEAPVVESYPDDSAHRIEVNGVEVHYFDFHPDAGGTPVIYIHGYSGSAFAAYYFKDHLGPEYRLIAPDLPGAGWSEKPPIEYTSEYYLEFLDSFAEALEIDRFHLMGHSMGGQLAAMFAADPDRASLVDRLILVAPYGLEDEAGVILEFLAEAGVLDDGLVLHNETVVELAIRLNVFHDATRIPPDFVKYIDVATFHTEGAVEALASVTRNIIGGPSIEEMLGEVRVPTLIVWGAEDRVLDFRYAADFYSRIPDPSLAAIPDCGHLPQVERPDLTAEAIRKFLGY